MGNRRIGQKRLQAVMENLNRSINMSGSSINARVSGCNGQFGAPPLVLDDASTLADGGDTDTVIHQYSDGLRLHVQNINAQTLLIPAASTSGMNYSYDQTDTDGVQWVTSMETHKGYPGVDRFVVGTSGAFFCEMTFTITDVSGTDDCAFGFRKVEAMQALVDNYDEMAAFNCISGDIKTETIINNATTVTTDTTANWADGESHTLRVDVSSTGVVTYTLDGGTAITTVAYTFDDGEVVTPFWYFIHDANLSETLILESFSCGKKGL